MKTNILFRAPGLGFCITWSGDWIYFGALGQTETDKNGGFEFWCSTDPEVISQHPWLQIDKSGYGSGYFFGALKKGDMGTLHRSPRRNHHRPGG